MNVATIQVPRPEAEAKLREYRKRVHAKADSEYARIREAYEAAADGKPLLVLSQVMEQAPRDSKARPHLAICRADQRQVEVRVGLNSDTFSIAGQVHWRTRDRETTVRRATPQEFTKYRTERRRTVVEQYGEQYARDNAWYWQTDPSGFALVPITPPDVKAGHDLSRRFVLWEVDAWADEAIRAVPDRDPYLLERIADDLFAVVAEWDLTPLEQAIMRDRARN